MIIASKSLDTKARQAFGKDNVGISTVDNIIKRLVLDPALEKPVREAYLIGAQDIKNTKIALKMREAIANKHPNNRVILVVRGRTEFTEGNGIDRILNNPSPEELRAAVESFVSEIERKGKILNNGVEGQGIPEYRPTYESEVDDILDDTVETVPEAPAVELTPPVEERVIQPAEELPPNPNGIVNRIKNCASVADINVLAKQLSAAEVVKDIIKDNKQYVVVEEQLRGIQEKIYAVFADPNLKSMEAKLDKVSAILVDKNALKAGNNTLIEQRVDAIITTIVSKTQELLHERLDQLDKAILSTGGKSVATDYARLAGIEDERANLLLEVTTLSGEITTIYERIDKLAREVTGDMTGTMTEMSGNPLVDAHLRLTHSNIVPEGTINAITRILETCEAGSDEFKRALRELKVMYQKLDRIITLDSESIAALNEVIALLRANKIEDTVVAETFLKKSMRIFVADSKTGRTIVPYILSRRKARQNANVLYVDLTGDSKLQNYVQDNVYTIEDFLQNERRQEFCIVTGNPADTFETAQELLVALTKAADYYRVINVVLRPEQVEIFDLLAADAKVVNYLITPEVDKLERYKEIVENTRLENVAQRVILNKCSIPVRPILERLGLLDRIDVHVAVIPYIPQIVECGILQVNPDEIATVVEGFREVCEVC